MTTRGKIISQLVTWSKTKDAASKFPLEDCFDLAYQRIVREVWPAGLDTEWLPKLGDPVVVPVVVRAQVHKLELPEDFQAAVAMWNNDQGLDPAVLKDMLERCGQYGGGVGPLFYSIVGTDVWYGPGAGGEIRLVYTRRDTEPVGENSTNYVLTYYPDLYFRAAMTELARYREDQENEATENGRYRALADQINSIAGDQRRGAGVTGMI